MEVLTPEFLERAAARAAAKKKLVDDARESALLAERKKREEEAAAKKACIERKLKLLNEFFASGEWAGIQKIAAAAGVNSLGSYCMRYEGDWEFWHISAHVSTGALFAKLYKQWPYTVDLKQALAENDTGSGIEKFLDQIRNEAIELGT